MSLHGLLTELVAGVVGTDDAAFVAYSLLAVARIDLLHHVVTHDHVSRDDLHAHLRSLIARVLT